MVFFMSKMDIPKKLRSKNKKSALRGVPSQWCKTNNVKYELVWDRVGGYYRTDSGRIARGLRVTGVNFDSEADAMAFKLAWF